MACGSYDIRSSFEVARPRENGLSFVLMVELGHHGCGSN